MRLTFDIDKETHEVLVHYIPHGMRKYAYKALIETFAESLKSDTVETLSRVFARQVGLKELIKEPKDKA